jgi:hypothetical protein
LLPNRSLGLCFGLKQEDSSPVVFYDRLVPDILTGDKWDLKEVFMPLLGDGDGFLLILFPVDFIALVGGILYDHLYMLGMYRVQYIEEELPINLATF